MPLRTTAEKAGRGLSAPKSKLKKSSKAKALGKTSSVTKPTVSSANKRSTTQLYVKKAAAVAKPSFTKPGYSLYDSTASESSEPYTKEAEDLFKGVANATDVVRQMVNCKKGRLVKHNSKTKRVKSSVSKLKRDHERLTNGMGGRESLDSSPKQTNRSPLIIPTAEKDGSSPVSVKSSIPAFNQRLHSSTPDPEKLFEQQQQEPTQQRSAAVQTSSSLFANAEANAKNNPDNNRRSLSDSTSSEGERTLPAPVPMQQHAPAVYHPSISNYLNPNQSGNPYPPSIPNYLNPNQSGNPYPPSIPNYLNPNQSGNPYPPSISNYLNPNQSGNPYPSNVSNYPNPTQYGNPISHGFHRVRNDILYSPDLPNSARMQVPSNSPRAQNMPPVTMEANTYIMSNPASVPSSPKSQNIVANANKKPVFMSQQGTNIVNESERVPLLLHVNLDKEAQSDISTDYVSLPSPMQLFGAAPQGPATVTLSPRSGDNVGFTPRQSGSEGFIPGSGNTGQSARSASSFTNVIGPYLHSTAGNQITPSLELSQNFQGQTIGSQLPVNSNYYVSAAGHLMYNEPQSLTVMDVAQNSHMLNTITNQPGVNLIHNTPQSMPAFTPAGVNQIMSTNTNNIPYSATQSHPQCPSQYIRPYATSFPNVPVPNVHVPSVPVPNGQLPNVHVPIVHVPNVPVPNVHVPIVAVPNGQVPSVHVQRVHVPSVPVIPSSGQYGGQHNWESTVTPAQVQVQFQSPGSLSSRKEIEVKIKTLKLLIRELKSKWTGNEVDTSDMSEMRQLTDDLEKTVNDIPVDSPEYTLEAEITKAIRPLKDENDRLKRELQLALMSKFGMIGAQQTATNDIEVLTLQISKTSLERQLREEKERNDELNDRVNDMQTQLDNMKAERHKMMLNMTEKDTERLKPKFVSQQVVSRLRTEVNLAHKQIDGLKLKVNAAEKENHILAITLGQRDTEIERLQDLVQTMKSSMSTMLQGHLQGNTDDTATKNQGWMGAGMNLQKLDKLLREEKTMGMMPRSPAKSVHSDPGHENSNPASPSSRYPSGRTQLSSKDVFRLTRDNLARHDHGMVSQQGHGSQSVAKPASILKTNYDRDKVRERELYSRAGAAGFASSSPIKSSMNGIVGKETLDNIVEELSDVTMMESMHQKQGKKIGAKMRQGSSPYKDTVTGLNTVHKIRSDSVTDARADNVTDVTSVSRYSVTDYFNKYSGQQQNTEIKDINNGNSDTHEMDISSIQHEPSVQDHRTSPAFIQNTTAQNTESQLKPYKTRSDPQISMPPPRVPISRAMLPGHQDDNVSIVSGMTMNSVSTAMTVDENVFRDGLANLDANIARIHENLQQTRDVYGVP